MSVYYSHKCSKERAKSFAQEVQKWCDKSKIPYKKIRGLTAYEGEVRIYNGLYENTMPQRRSRKLVAYKNIKGEWEGDIEAIQSVGDKADAVYIMDYHSKKVLMYTTIFLDEWNDKECRKEVERAVKRFFNLKPY